MEYPLFSDSHRLVNAISTLGWRLVILGLNVMLSKLENGIIIKTLRSTVHDYVLPLESENRNSNKLSYLNCILHL